MTYSCERAPYSFLKEIGNLGEWDSKYVLNFNGLDSGNLCNKESWDFAKFCTKFMLTSKKIHYDDATFAGAQTTRTQISQHVC